MPFNIVDFRNSLTKDVANPTNYEVTITREPNTMLFGVGPLGSEFPQTINFRCETCSLPSKNFKIGNMTSYGPPIKVAYAAEYSDTTFTFIATEDMPEKSYLYNWQNSIIDNHAMTGGFNTNNVTYYDEYIGEIEINYFDKGGENTYRITFFECYPVFVHETPMSWNSNNEYVRITVNLTYKYFIEEQIVGGVALPPVSIVDTLPDATEQLGGFSSEFTPILNRQQTFEQNFPLLPT